MSERRHLETGWTDRLRSGEQPSPAELREHLLSVHRRNTGFTEAYAGRARDAQGRTSYEWLAEIVDPARHGRVLDLACGSGPLLMICAERFRSRVALIGVDMSPDELALARARLPAGAAELRQGLAQDLSWLPDGAVDAVLCHWALTLMDPVGPVLAEARRVLRPGGVFAAIVDGDMALSPGYAATHRLIYGWARREIPGYGEVDLGDPRVRDGRALAALAQEAFGPGAEGRIEPGLVRLAGAPGALAREVAGFFYASLVLSPGARDAMLEELAALIAENAESSGGAGLVAPDGPASFAMPVSRLVVSRP